MKEQRSSFSIKVHPTAAPFEGQCEITGNELLRKQSDSHIPKRTRLFGGFNQLAVAVPSHSVGNASCSEEPLSAASFSAKNNA